VEYFYRILQDFCRTFYRKKIYMRGLCLSSKIFRLKNLPRFCLNDGHGEYSLYTPFVIQRYPEISGSGEFTLNIFIGSFIGSDLKKTRLQDQSSGCTGASECLPQSDGVVMSRGGGCSVRQAFVQQTGFFSIVTSRRCPDILRQHFRYRL